MAYSTTDPSQTQKVLGIIPARYGSTRFPGKPLVMIGNKSMIRRVYEQSMKAPSIDKVLVATDDERIFSHVKDFGGNVIMTGPHHKSGTERCFEALQKLAAEGESWDIAVNIQGDEPFIDPDSIGKAVELLQHGRTHIATLAKQVTSREDLENPNVVKVVFDSLQNALYFSRYPIPYMRNVTLSGLDDLSLHFKHVGLGGFIEVWPEVLVH